jgi:hypothetical protein
MKQPPSQMQRHTFICKFMLENSKIRPSSADPMIQLSVVRFCQGQCSAQIQSIGGRKQDFDMHPLYLRGCYTAAIAYTVVLDLRFLWMKLQANPRAFFDDVRHHLLDFRERSTNQKDVVSRTKVSETRACRCIRAALLGVLSPTFL